MLYVQRWYGRKLGQEKAGTGLLNRDAQKASGSQFWDLFIFTEIYLILRPTFDFDATIQADRPHRAAVAAGNPRPNLPGRGHGSPRPNLAGPGWIRRRGSGMD